MRESIPLTPAQYATDIRRRIATYIDLPQALIEKSIQLDQAMQALELLHPEDPEYDELLYYCQYLDDEIIYLAALIDHSLAQLPEGRYPS